MKTKFLAAIVAGAVLVGGAVAYAHAQNGSHAAAAPKPGQVIQRAIKRLNLTPEQLSKIKSELRAEKPTLEPLLKRLFAARKDLRETINRPGAEEVAVRAAAAKVAEVESDLAVERARISGKIRPILTDEQIEKIKRFQDRVDEFFIDVLRTIGGHLDEKQ